MKTQLLALAAAAAATLSVQDPAPTEAPAGPEVGKPAPTFRINDHTGKATAIGGAQEDATWTVVAFFPKAATPG